MKHYPKLLQTPTIENCETAAPGDMENKKPIITNYRSIETKEPKRIKVRVHIPKNVLKNVRQQKINKIYDILHPKNSL